MKKFIYIISVIALVAVIIIILVSNKRATQKITDLASQVSTDVSVQMDIVKETPINFSFMSNGTLEPERELSFVSDVTARVVNIMADEGTYVKKGQIMVQADDEMLKADFMSSEASYNALKTDLERFTNAIKQGGVTDQQLETVRSQYIAAESRYISSKRRLSDARIKAPINGMVTKRYIEVGAYLNPGARLFDIIDESQLRAWCNVTERQLQLVKKGEKVKVICNTFPEESFSGSVNFVGVKADKSLNFPVEVKISGANKKLLKAGMYVSVYFDTQTEKPGILISRNAITGSVQTAKVYVVKNGIASERDVVVGMMKDKEVEILKGLQVGDSIVVTGLINLSEGKRVRNKN